MRHNTPAPGLVTSVVLWPIGGLVIPDDGKQSRNMHPSTSRTASLSFLKPLCLDMFSRFVMNHLKMSPPSSSVHGILQARILEWVAIPFSRGSSRPRDWTQVSWIARAFFTAWATREALQIVYTYGNLFIWVRVWESVVSSWWGGLGEWNLSTDDGVLFAWGASRVRSYIKGRNTYAWWDWPIHMVMVICPCGGCGCEQNVVLIL